jgi:hypothetical protein
MFEGEELKHLVVGRYEGGFALLCATNHRVLLIDKKPFYLTIEDVRYDMIADVQFNHRLLDATLNLGTLHKSISFTAYNHAKLREFTGYVQERVMMYRQQQAQPHAQVMQQPTVSQNTTQNDPVQGALAVAQSEPIATTPYRMPVMIRRRVSRFY